MDASTPNAVLCSGADVSMSAGGSCGGARSAPVHPVPLYSFAGGMCVRPSCVVHVADGGQPVVTAVTHSDAVGASGCRPCVAVAAPHGCLRRLAAHRSIGTVSFVGSSCTFASFPLRGGQMWCLSRQFAKSMLVMRWC